ncbi:MAG: DNA-processing protein DprA [Rubrivivax sp.]
MLDTDEFSDWFRLLESPGLGREGVRRLLAAFGSPSAALQASSGARRQVLGPRAQAGLSEAPEHFELRLAQALQWWRGGPQRHVLTLADAEYPAQLLQTPDPPLLLYVQGRLELLAQPSIAIVGSRNATAQGMDNARAFATHLSRESWCIVSGLAQGIDRAAHEGGLDGPGSTVAVVGSGLDIVYPSRHRALAQSIGEAGAMISEFAPGTPPISSNFPMRNRIIAGLSQGTLVVEAAVQSGSLITARVASECGREVFAVPGSIHSPLSRGCHALIRQGAKLVESAQDILEELRPAALAGAKQTAQADEHVPEALEPLLRDMGHDPVTLDALGARSGWPVHVLSAKLLELELAGAVERLPGGLYQRRGRG